VIRRLPVTRWVAGAAMNRWHAPRSAVVLGAVARLAPERPGAHLVSGGDQALTWPLSKRTRQVVELLERELGARRRDREPDFDRGLVRWRVPSCNRTARRSHLEDDRELVLVDHLAWNGSVTIRKIPLGPWPGRRRSSAAGGCRELELGSPSVTSLGGSGAAESPARTPVSPWAVGRHPSAASAVGPRGEVVVRRSAGIALVSCGETDCRS
jgi:hypothetical protein